MTNEQKAYINELIKLYKATAKSYERCREGAFQRYSVYDVASSETSIQIYNNIVKDLENLLKI